MKHFVLLVLLCLCIFSRLFSQISNILPVSSSIANTSVSDNHNWNGFSNPAILGYLEKPELGFQIENRFLIKELSTKSAHFAYSNSLLNSSISFSHFGYSKYQEMIIGIGFARSFAQKFAIGIQGNYYTTYYSASNSYHGVFFPQIGLSVNLSKSFGIGFSASNPFQSVLVTEYVSKRIPSIFSLGSSYSFCPELEWRMQMDKEVSSNYRFATGFDYRMLEKATLKLGMYGSDYLVPCLGVGLKLGVFNFDLNCELHPLLGLTTFGALKYHFRK